MEEIKQQILSLKERLQILIEKLNIEKKRNEIPVLEKEISSEGFWDDPKNAQAKTRLLSQNKDEIQQADNLVSKLNSIDEVANSPDGEILADDLSKELKSIEKEMGKIEINVYLGGKYDNSSAIVSIHSGQGGTEAMDWAQMVQRMYYHYAEKKGWKIDVIDIIPGDEAGIKSITMVFEGSFAYGHLKFEKGAHRLVRQSPFNADKLRQTSFCLVEVLPQIEETEAVAIPEGDLDWQFFHSSSKGGQNVQKVSTAVRLRHLPSGIVVTSQSERYQERNREIALNLLKAKLWEIEDENRRKQEKDLKGEYKIAGWGNQIRSYVLHPYKMVKDLRTDYEVNDPFSVLDGDLDGFIDAELKFFA